MKITEYPLATGFDENDVLLKDGTNGTKTIKIPDAAAAFLDAIMPPEMHRNIYRGKALGATVTEAQKEAISDGSFKDLFIGDYWTIGNADYCIADMNYWLNCGDTSFTKNHLVMTTRKNMYSAKMNDENITTGGYTGSKMYTENLAQAKETIRTAFGDMLLTHKEYLTTTVTNGYPSAGAWFESDVELMNEIMVYGCPIYLPGGNGSTTVNRYTIDNSQLALFALNPRMIKTRENYWLRDVVSAAYFAHVGSRGDAASGSASDSLGVRPVFPIGVN